MPARLLIFGLGYSTTRFVELFGERFETILATRREEGAPHDPRVRLLVFDGLHGSDALRTAIARATHVLVSIPPDHGDDPVLRAFGADLAAAPSLAWVGYLSTVGVYGDFGGAWIDETTPIRPSRSRNISRAKVEEAWLDLGQRTGCSVQIFRIAGIYGPGRNAIENLREGTARRIVKPGQVFNRIHVDDIAGALAAAIERPEAGPIFNVADDEPAPPQEVIAYAAELLGVNPPAEIEIEQAQLSPMGRSFYGENKRVSNQRLRGDLGYALRYPTFREGLAALRRAIS